MSCVVVCCHVLCGLLYSVARLAQSAERKALTLVVVGSSPTVGAFARRWRNLRGAFFCVVITLMLPRAEATLLASVLIQIFDNSCVSLSAIVSLFLLSFVLIACGFFMRFGFSFARLLFRSLVISYSSFSLSTFFHDVFVRFIDKFVYRARLVFFRSLLRLVSVSLHVKRRAAPARPARVFTLSLVTRLPSTPGLVV